ncbi:MAG: hypothetical protein IPI85_01290 [Dehalococcoidia bacterium]|nr:hypothetical protein [Dehalococcoidia bacterium]
MEFLNPHHVTELGFRGANQRQRPTSRDSVATFVDPHLAELHDDRPRVYHRRQLHDEGTVIESLKALRRNGTETITGESAVWND